MKKIAKNVLLCVLLFITIVFPGYISLTVQTSGVSVKSFYRTARVLAADIKDNAVIALSGDTDGEIVSVDAYLMQNTGLNGLTVEISYDVNAMTLVDIEKGEALSSLNMMTTNIDTEKGYGITPFVVNWSGDENDDSNGLLFTMKFSVKDNVNDGKYAVTLKVNKKGGASYILDGDAASKNVLVSGVQVEIKGNKPTAVVENSKTKKRSDALLWISISVAVVSVITLIILAIIKFKGKKSWTKVE